MDRDWKLVDGDNWIFGFGKDQGEADAALKVVKGYGTNLVCFVGRPDASFQYLLVGGQAPQGARDGEICTAFDPAGLVVDKKGFRWRIMTGEEILERFKKAGEAYRSLDVIQQYAFTHRCTIAGDDDNFLYYRL